MSTDDRPTEEILHQICEAHDLPWSTPVRYSQGSCPVFRIDAVVIKFFCPRYRQDWQREGEFLRHLQGKVIIPTPELIALGELEEWLYVVMGRLSGHELRDLWPQLDRQDRLGICEQLGAAILALHRLPVGTVSASYPDWISYIQQQIQRGPEHHRQIESDPFWLGQICSYLNSTSLSELGLDPPIPTVILHTELMRDHLFVQRQGASWQISGMFDFESSLVGHPEYELPSVGLFVTSGDPELWRAYLLSYGYSEADLNAQLQRRIMIYTLLHPYSNLKWYREFMPTPEAANLQDLESIWWAF